MRLVFMGTPDFAVPCLDILLREGHEISCVITQPDRPKGRGQKLAQSPVKDFAVKNALPVLQPERFNNSLVIEELKKLSPEVIVVVAFGQLLSETILNLPVYGCINVHASILPAYRGAAPIHWAVINGDKTTGVTTMLLDKGMDTGDIVLKQEIAIGEDETAGELHNRLSLLGSQVLARTIGQAKEGFMRIAQDHGSATYAPKLTRALEHIDWRKNVGEIHDLVRGLNPWPGAYTAANNQAQILKILRTKIVSREKAGVQPGIITEFTAKGFIVSAGKGQLEVLEVQPANKKKITAVEYARGYRLCPGQSLE